MEWIEPFLCPHGTGFIEDQSACGWVTDGKKTLIALDHMPTPEQWEKVKIKLLQIMGSY